MGINFTTEDYESASEGIQLLIGAPSPEETALLQNELALSEERLAAIQTQSGVQNSLLSAIGYDAATGVYDPTKATLEMSKIDPETEALVDEIFGHEMDTALEEITQVLAPARGLRPTDTPITDRAFRVGGEIASGAAQAKLDLGQQAFLNRLSLLEGVGELGLGIADATGSDSGTTATNLEGNRYSVVPSNLSGTTTSFDFGDFLSGIGELDDLFDIPGVT